MYCSVGVVRRGIDFLCTYSSSDELQPGQLIAVYFKNKKIIGIVFDNAEDSDYLGDIKQVSDVLPYTINKVYLNFIKFVSEYNLIPMSSALKLLCPFNLTVLLKQHKSHVGIRSDVIANVILNEEQQNAVNKIELEKFDVYLLHGVTGSGKTEVFLEVAKQLNNAQILILVPEITLSNVMAESIAKRCGREVFIWHNSVSPAKKLSIWQNAIQGEPIIVVGARSALFIPFSNLKLIVVDEEHDPTFKQNDHQIYNARDMAVYLASLLKIPIILSSATPSVESYKNAIDCKYKYIKLTSRYYLGANLPTVNVTDMRFVKKNAIFSPETIEKIKYYLNNNQQILIFVNRRGYATKRLCPNCGWKIMCPACDTWLCYHATGSRLICHHCGYTSSNIKQCKRCGNEYLVNFGIGIEKVYAECQKLFTKASIVMCSSDNMNNPTKIDEVINKIKNNEVNIIIGTQILAKGHNFNSLNLVVVANLDYMLYTENFRAVENTFQLLYQVTGRAGRTGNFQSEVIIQTYNPEEPLLTMINNQSEFYKNELNNRKLTNMPPYGHIISIEISSSNDNKANEYAQELTQNLRNASIANTIVVGVIIPNLYKTNYKYRYNILLISKNSIQNKIKDILKSYKPHSGIFTKIDVDPYNFD